MIHYSIIIKSKHWPKRLKKIDKISFIRHKNFNNYKKQLKQSLGYMKIITLNYIKLIFQIYKDHFKIMLKHVLTYIKLS